MGTRSSQMKPNRNRLFNKIVLGLAAAFAAATLGFAGIAAAQSPSTGDNNAHTFINYCKQHYQQLGYSNLGQCVSNHNGHGHGYGGSGDNDHDDHGNHHHHFHFHFHNFFGGWWHHIEHHF